ncbi:MAG: DUF4249 family protein [Spirosomataceae bacterium]
MKNYRYSWCILLLLAVACRDNSKLNLPPNSNKIVLNSLLIAHKSPEVYVGKTWNITDFTPSKTYYEDAKVELWENDILLGALTLEDSLYKLKSVKLTPLKSYIIRVNVPNAGQVESKPVVVPPDIELIQITLDPNIKWITREILIQEPILVEMNVKNFPYSSNYLVSSAHIVKNGETIIFNTITTENVEISASNLDFSSNNCYALFPELSGMKGKRSIGYNMQCFLENTKKIGLVVDKVGQLGSNRIKGDFIKVSLAIYSSEYLQFAKAAQIIEGADNAFIETKPTYSNIIGGIGFVTAINQKDTTLSL